MFLLKCPVCRARFKGDESLDELCRRCGSDLSLLRRTYAQARSLREEAQRSLARKHDDYAFYLARQALVLVNERQTRETLAATLVALGLDDEAAAVLDTPSLLAFHKP